jgi:TolA-binding protein
MSQRRRILGATLALVILFLVLSTRRSTGAHPRDLRGELRDVDERDARLSRIKEPPGEWDPEADRFVNQQGDGDGEGKGLQEQIDEIARQMDDLPDEPIQRKTLKKNNQQQQQQKTLEDVDSERVVDTGRVGGVAQVDGAGAETKPAEKAEEKPAQNVYDAADGMVWHGFYLTLDYRVILTQAPIIVPSQSVSPSNSQIFSKTGCPHSRDAKRILLDNHKL